MYKALVRPVPIVKATKVIVKKLMFYFQTSYYGSATSGSSASGFSSNKQPALVSVTNIYNV